MSTNRRVLKRSPLLTLALTIIQSLGFVSIVAAAAPMPVRLAVISEAPESAAAADLLTVTLSKDSSVVLLDRAEVDRIYREQALTAATGDFLKLGQLLGADGLIVLSLAKETDPAVLGLRMVAVKPGVVVRQQDYPWPLEEQTDWANLVTKQLQPPFSKLTTLAKDAVPLSILNLRSAVSSTEAEGFEQELTLLLYNRLMQEKDLFVLERRRMELLADEKQLAGTAESAFWAGSYLLEGIINKEGVSRDSVTISAQLRPPGKQAGISIEVAGPRTNLVAVVNDLAARLLGALKRQSTTEWQPLAEADQYVDEATRMLKWNLPKQARSAAESAWALGRQNSVVARLRIRAYCEAAGSPGVCVIYPNTGDIVFGRYFVERFHDYNQHTPSDYALMTQRFADMVHAEELYLDGFHTFVASSPELDRAWLNLGTNLLEQVSWWLRYFYFTAEARPGQENRLADTRRLTREIANEIEQHPGVAVADSNHSVLQVKARHSAFWADTPEQGLQVCRQMVDAGLWPLVRTRFFNGVYRERSVKRQRQGGQIDVSPSPYADRVSPALAGWTWADRKRCPDLWLAFVRELCNSPKPLVSLEGRILRCSYAWANSEFELSFQELIGYVKEHRDEIGAAGLDSALLGDLHKLFDLGADALVTDERNQLRHRVWTPFEAEFAPFSAAQQEMRRKRQELLARAPEIEAAKAYLHTQEVFEFNSFTHTLMRSDYRPEEAVQLLPLVEPFKARLLTNGTSPGSATSVNFWVNALLGRLTNTNPPPQIQTTRAQSTAPSAAATNHIALRQPAGPMTPPVMSGMPPGLPGTSLAGGHYNESQGRSIYDNLPGWSSQNVLHVTNFWRVPTVNITNRYASPRIFSWCWRDGKLWLEVRHTDIALVGEIDFFGINLTTFAFERAHFEDRDFRLAQPMPAPNGRRIYDIYNGSVYLGLFDRVMRYKDGQWELFPLPVQTRPRPVRVGDRLFFTSEDAILEFTGPGDFRVLASTRRRPAQNALDLLNNYQNPDLFNGSDGTVRACVQGVIYALSSDNTAWREVAKIPGGAWMTCRAVDEGLFIHGTSPNSAGELWSIGPGASGVELLFRQTSLQTPSPGFRPFAPTAVPNSTSRFSAPPGVVMAEQTPWIQDGSFWFFTGSMKFQTNAAGRFQLREADRPQAWLMRYQNTGQNPDILPLQVALGDFSLPPDTGARLSSSGNEYILAQPTPQGLALSRLFVPGFWFVPKAQLEAALRGHSN